MTRRKARPLTPVKEKKLAFDTARAALREALENLDQAWMDLDLAYADLAEQVRHPLPETLDDALDLVEQVYCKYVGGVITVSDLAAVSHAMARIIDGYFDARREARANPQEREIGGAPNAEPS